MDFGSLTHKQSGTEPKNEDCVGSLKHQRSGLVDDSLRLPKISKQDGQKMLCFASSEHPRYSGNGSSASSSNIAFSISQDDHREAMRGPLSRIKGPFTPSQWMELEHQAQIYKHIVANVPVPVHLLLPLKRSLYLHGSHGSYPSNIFGWGIPFHVGLSRSSNDPEPGRCRRTDGKKWRCSRDAVADQKYCERHINRGRHRSRKPVEGGHSNGHRLVRESSSSTIVDSSSKTASMLYNDLGVLQTRATSTYLKSKDISFDEAFKTGFGLVLSDSLLSPISDTNNPTSYHMQQVGLKYYDWTQLSMSIPDFSLVSSTSPAREKSSSASTLKLPDGLDPVQKYGSWFPVIDGPLGEALTNATIASSNLQLDWDI